MLKRHRYGMQQRGAALATMAIMLLLLGALALASMRLLADHRLIAIAYLQREQALRAAEVGLAAAEHWLATRAVQTEIVAEVLPGTCMTSNAAGRCAADLDGKPGWMFARFRETGAAANTRMTEAAITARYVVETLPDHSAGLPLTQPGTYGASPAIIHRITAAGFDREGGMARLLQTVVRPASGSPAASAPASSSVPSAPSSASSLTP